MPIAQLKPITAQPPKANVPELRKQTIKDVTLDGSAVPLDQVTVFMDGSPWTLNAYYSQVKVPDNASAALDTGASSVLQQYQRYMNFEIRVTTALTTDYDSDTGISRLSGVATVYPSIVPIVDDMFVAAAGSGREGIYRVNNVERSGINLKSAFVINYTLISFVDAHPEELANLEQKTIRTYYFDKERVLDGGYPLLKEEDHNAYYDLEKLYREIIDYYFTTFFNPNYQCLVIPGQQTTVLDTYLIDFLLAIVEVSDHPLIMKHRRFSTDGDPFMEQDNLWDMLLKRDIKMLSDINTKYQYQTLGGFQTNSWMKGLSYSGVKYIAYPKEPDKSTVVMFDSLPKIGATWELAETTNRKGLVSSAIAYTFATDVKNYMKIYPVLTDDSYVFSSDFYTTGSNLSLLEELVHVFLHRQALDFKLITAVLQEYRQWGRLEQFYYLPICLLLVKQCRLELYS